MVLVVVVAVVPVAAAVAAAVVDIEIVVVVLVLVLVVVVIIWPTLCLDCMDCTCCWPHGELGAVLGQRACSKDAQTRQGTFGVFGPFAGIVKPRPCF